MGYHFYFLQVVMMMKEKKVFPLVQTNFCQAHQDLAEAFMRYK